MALSDVKAGDEVIMIQYVLGRSPARQTIVTVDRVTETQIIVGNQRFRRKDGAAVGDSRLSWTAPWIEANTDEGRERVAKSRAKWAEHDRREAIFALLRKISFSDLPTSALERIVAIIEAEKGEE
jgi:hypothetical protein